ncbi:histone acetyltransferase [Mycoemilia scoparia]|uniref:Histone acetyltransferase n=1 Tax=Mycoemilia scoparia TaxID=417184 RepID=A0A9W8A2A9_9FUNG|nr:histone acetyltransferase [Mycoemilia scoparia]
MAAATRNNKCGARTYTLAHPQAVLDKIKQRSGSHIVHKGLEAFKRDGAEWVDPMEIPGIKESGWTPELDQRYLGPTEDPLKTWQTLVVGELLIHPSAWPFQKKVDENEVPDYYQIITDPMDLTTLEANVDNKIYTTLEAFVADTKKIFNNARKYNGESTRYARCARQLEEFFDEKVREWKSR